MLPVRVSHPGCALAAFGIRVAASRAAAHPATLCITTSILGLCVLGYVRRIPRVGL